jgi:hypothetical protein
MVKGFQLLNSRRTVPFQLLTMRIELPYFVPDAEVVALVTLLKNGGAHAWSKATYGDNWATLTLTGVVHAVTDTAALVR